MSSADFHELVRTRRHQVNRSTAMVMIEHVMCLLRAEHSTGTVMIDVSQGTPVMIRIEERQKIGPVKLEEVPL